MKRTILLLLTTISVALSALAGPARVGAFTHTQSDGTQITVEMFGDEFYHYTVMDGVYTVVLEADNNYYYAAINDGRMVASDVVATTPSKMNAQQRKAAMASVGLRPTFTPNRTTPTFNDLMRSNASRANGPAWDESTGELADVFVTGRWGAKREGKLNALIVLVEFQDVKFTVSDPHDRFTRLLTEEGYSDYGGTGCANDFFKINSNGKFEVDCTVVGPYTLKEDRKYYGGNDPTYDQDQRPSYMVVEGCNMARVSGDITDFSKFDNDGDGNIDMVFVFYAGHNEAEGGPADSVWPHKSEVPSAAAAAGQLTVGGKTMKVYACTSELRHNKGADMSGIGSFCHEFSHVLGLPDFYDTNYNADGKPTSFGLNYLSIMSSGNYINSGCTPPAYSLLERWFLGWAKPTEITSSGQHVLAPVYDNEGYIMFANDTKDEFFLFENRNVIAARDRNHWDSTMLGGYSSFVGGEGMLVYHIDATSKYLPKWNANAPNADPDHMCARLVRAVATDDEASSNKWFFPGGSKITSLTDKTTPALVNWAGERLSYSIENIAIDGENVTFLTTEITLQIDTRQYDSLIDWSGSEHTATYSSWQVNCTSADGQHDYSFKVDHSYILLSPLTPDTTYHVEVCGVQNGVVSEPLHVMDIVTQSNARSPMSALNMEQYEYEDDEKVRLSVKNLDVTPEQIEWFVDGQKVTDLYATLPIGKHRICAAITDTEGNMEYLYRYIEVVR